VPIYRREGLQRHLKILGFAAREDRQADTVTSESNLFVVRYAEGANTCFGTLIKFS
jgi:hypothetical protein